MFKNMRLGVKLQIVFLIISLLGFLVAALGIFNMGRIHDKAELIYKRELMGLSYIKDANVDLIYIGRARANYMLADSQEERQLFKSMIDQYSSKLTDNVVKAKHLFISLEAKKLFEEYDTVYTHYHTDVEKLIELTANDTYRKNNAEVKEWITESRKNAATLDNLFTSLSKLKEERAKEEYEETTLLYDNSRFLMILLVVCSTTIGVILGMLTTKGITKKLGGEPEYAAQIAKEIASGDLTIKVKTAPNDKSSLLFAMKEMQANLANIFYQVKVGAQTITIATSEIAKGNMDLSHRTEEQASALEETASSMEEITATVSQNCDNAKKASAIAHNVVDAVKVSSKEVDKILSTMMAIESSSQEMVEIISVVEGIAFQTNILALNAAVEAARAGEQGRGFAVVAGEVRILAQRSSTAAKEIKDLINKSVVQISNGAKQAEITGTSMNSIVDKVESVSTLINDMNCAGQEQNSGINQINEAIMQIDSVTQQNAALVEEAAAASQSLQEQSVNLSQLVNMFKTDFHQLGENKESISLVNQPMLNMSIQKKQNNLASKQIISTKSVNTDGWESY